MKKYLILLIFLAGCKTAKQGAGQEQAISKTDKISYQSLKTFNGDTLKYMQVNFVDNKSSYIHQPLSKLTGVSEIPFKNYVTGSNANDVNSVPDVSLKMYSYAEEDKRIAGKKNPNIIVIYWEKPLAMDTVVKLIRTDHGIWKGASREYFERQTIKDIQLVKYDFNK